MVDRSTARNFTVFENCDVIKMVKMGIEDFVSDPNFQFFTTSALLVGLNGFENWLHQKCIYSFLSYKM